ncbi:ThiF family [Carpediemonas membranifera]|uniref:SUMO-activating enzyme subunit n=1 Tax=Carpediemonas membranifera TaxID=201153 RepID=A0A8J6E9H3_9EUKA|nr:ThiF family [Carpediemonas membranifera]|eukprot:KAG9393340.1 ThiF family [Carpediemonas membranifera]
MTRTSTYKRLYGKDGYQKIRDSRIFVVGAGGIGCELLKNIAVVGFGHVELIDLDTIDVTNLNRQFLFKRKHVGQPKAVVAKEAALALNKDMTIVAHHANVKDDKFNIAFYRQFNVVINALDNADARKHVNRMCLLSNVPLIDAGTNGLRGNVITIIPYLTECYECAAKPPPKTLPICTIRSVPSKPEHCIAWAKYLYQRVFGETDDTNVLSDITLASLYEKDADPTAVAHALVRKLFRDDVIAARDTVESNMVWSFGPPRPVELGDDDVIKPVEITTLSDTEVLAEEMNMRAFVEAVCVLYRMAFNHTGEKASPLSFDKDEPVGMAFVAAAANLRMICYKIDPITIFDARSIAGSIVPAVSTTNSMVSGLAIHRAATLITKGKPTSLDDPVLRTNYVTFFGAKPLQAIIPLGANPACQVCGRKATGMHCTATSTLGDLVDVLEKKLEDDDVAIEAGGTLLWTGDETAARKRTLVDLGIADSHTINVTDSDDKEYVLVALYRSHGPIELDEMIGYDPAPLDDDDEGLEMKRQPEPGSDSDVELEESDGEIEVIEL